MKRDLSVLCCGSKVSSPQVKPAVCQAFYVASPFPHPECVGRVSAVVFEQSLPATPAMHHGVVGLGPCHTGSNLLTEYQEDLRLM